MLYRLALALACVMAIGFSIPAEAAKQKELAIADQPGYVPTPEEELLPAEYRAW